MHASTLFATVVLLSAALINAYDPVKMLCLVNQQRTSNGLKPLGLSQQLGNAAQEHSDDQARMRSMTHNGSDGSSPGDRVERAGYNWRSVAENVAYGYGDEEECMKEWMNSPGHRENILGRDYTHFGSAVGYAGSTPYYTQDFGGDGQSHSFPECPSGGSYGDSGGANDNANSGGKGGYNGGGGAPSSNYGGSGGDQDYGSGGNQDYSSGGDQDYSSGGQSPSGGSKYPSGGRSPSTNYGGDAPSSGHRHKSGRRHKKSHKNNSYGGDVNDYDDDKKKVKSYGRTPKYGGQKDSHDHRGKSYGNEAPSRNYGGKRGSQQHKSYGGNKGSKGSYGSKVSYGSKGGHTSHKAY